MKDYTADEIAAIFSAAGDSVTLINADANFAAYQTANPFSSYNETEWKAMIERNVAHLEVIKDYKQADDTTSIWTSEDFTAIDAAIVAGKKVYS